MKDRKKTRRVISGFNGLRTLALLGVLLYHTFPAVVRGGFFGVVIFFVVSGFLTAYSTVTRPSFRIGSYYARRFVRIYPALLVVLFSTIGVLTLKDPSRLSNTQAEVTSVLLGYNNYWQISANADYFANLANQSPFTHLWYIAILIQFELVWPILYAVTRRQRVTEAVLLVLTVVSALIMPVCTLLGVNITAVYYATHTRVFALLAGALLGILQAKGRLRNPLKKINPFLPVLLFVILTIVMYAMVSGTDRWIYLIGINAYTILVCLIVWLLSSGTTSTGRLLDNTVSNFFSKYSYEIYLWQYPVMFVTALFIPGTASKLIQIPVIMILSIWLNMFTNRPKKRTARKKKASA